MVPMNQGVFRAIDFVLPEGLSQRALSGADQRDGGAIFPAVTDCVLGTFIQLVPERCMTGPTGLVNIVSGGRDPRPGFEREFVTYIWLEGGWGGRPAKRDNHTSMCLFATSATNQPIEQHERLFPLRFDAYRLEPDSFGAGRHRGAPGHPDLALHPRRRVFSSLGDGERFGPWGFAGGKDAPGSRIVYAPGTAEERNLGMFCTGLGSSVTASCSFSTPAAAATATHSNGLPSGCSRTSRMSSSRRQLRSASSASSSCRASGRGDSSSTQRRPRRSRAQASVREPGRMTRVLVTGAGGQLGSAIVAALAARGATVVASDLRAADGVIAADVTSDADVARLVRDAAPLDGCVNAFGAEGPVVPLEELDLDDVRALSS